MAALWVGFQVGGGLVLRIRCSRGSRGLDGTLHSGSYSIYHALAIAIGTLDPTHQPNHALTEPPVEILFIDAWADPKKIVSFAPQRGFPSISIFAVVIEMCS